MKLKWILLCLILGFFTTVILYHLNPSKNRFVPEEMVGRWETDSPRYKNRYLELSRVTVIYATGDDNLEVNSVKSIEKQLVENEPVYTIHYKNGSEGDLFISFFWDASKKEIRLKNQKEMVWKKKAEPL